jgi:PPK2 family polyphosphate:nucleotide phosphotransferase
VAKKHRFEESKFIVDSLKALDLSKRSTKAGKELIDKELAVEALAADVSSLREQQQMLFASKQFSMLIILQGMDASGKDGTIRHVMGAINPQGCRVYSFGAPNATEIKHHFLWRAGPCLPERGMISLFNRSYYEEVLVVKVHPNFLEPQQIPGIRTDKPKSLEKLWQMRYKEIRTYERALANNGTIVLKFYLHISKNEQKERLLERLKDPVKNWKFNARDLDERKLWDQYFQAFETCLANTSTAEAPWFVVPADDKWYARAAIADIIAARIERLNLTYPEVAAEQQADFLKYIQELEKEPST